MYKLSVQSVQSNHFFIMDMIDTYNVSIQPTLCTSVQ